MDTYSLHELNEYIRRILALNLQESLWIHAEIAQMDASKGHYYLNLIQKSEEDEQIIAQSAAIIWSATYRKLKRKLGKTANEVLQEGMEVLIQVKIDFHERYGLKLLIEDIDPAYTLGKLAVKRQKIVEELLALGLIEKNSGLHLPPVLQRIAIISSENAAGLQDFVQQLQNNPYGYKFQNHLFPTAVQGINAEKEIIAQLKRIAKQKTKFDCVAIVRGGGSKLDLAAFDGLELCKAVANMPLPVLSGVGHDVDESVLDLVAHTALKTPTAVADFIITRNLHFESTMIEGGNLLRNLLQEHVKEQAYLLQNLEQFIQMQSQQQLAEQQQMLQFITQELPIATQRLLKDANRELDSLDKIAAALSPEATLKRGFTITYHKGKAIHSGKGLKKGDEIETEFSDKKIKSKVI